MAPIARRRHPHHQAKGRERSRPFRHARAFLLSMEARPVIAGPDPAIHPLERTLLFWWMRGS